MCVLYFIYLPIFTRHFEGGKCPLFTTVLMGNTDPSYDRRQGTNEVILIRVDLKWGWRVGINLCGSGQGLVMDASELAKQILASQRGFWLTEWI
jgi:hypothetical protein